MKSLKYFDRIHGKVIMLEVDETVYQFVTRSDFAEIKQEKQFNNRTSVRFEADNQAQLYFVDVHADVLNSVIQQEEACNIKAALKKLPLEEQTLIQDYYFNELTYTQIRKKYGYAYSSINKKLHRTYRKLGELIHE